MISTAEPPTSSAHAIRGNGSRERSHGAPADVSDLLDFAALLGGLASPPALSEPPTDDAPGSDATARPDEQADAVAATAAPSIGQPVVPFPTLTPSAAPAAPTSAAATVTAPIAAAPGNAASDVTASGMTASAITAPDMTASVTTAPGTTVPAASTTIAPARAVTPPIAGRGAADPAVPTPVPAAPTQANPAPPPVTPPLIKTAAPAATVTPPSITDDSAAPVLTMASAAAQRPATTPLTSTERSTIAAAPNLETDPTSAPPAVPVKSSAEPLVATDEPVSAVGTDTEHGARTTGAAARTNHGGHVAPTPADAAATGDRPAAAEPAPAVVAVPASAGVVTQSATREPTTSVEHRAASAELASVAGVTREATTLPLVVDRTARADQSELPSYTSATALPESQQPLTGALVNLRRRNGTHELTVQLHPAELGAVSVRAVVHGTSLVVSVDCADAGGHAAVHAALSSLEQELRRSGFEGVSVTVGQQDQGFARDTPTQPTTGGKAGRDTSDEPGARRENPHPRPGPDRGLDRWL
jgi:flagellar hook-length control protein FliK